MAKHRFDISALRQGHDLGLRPAGFFNDDLIARFQQLAQSKIIRLRCPGRDQHIINVAGVSKVRLSQHMGAQFR